MLKIFFASFFAMPAMAQGCCRALSAECLACVDGVSVEDFCNQLLLHSDIANVPGCPTADTRELATASLPPRACCKAMTASCLSCSEGISVEELCARPSFAQTRGCPTSEPRALATEATLPVRACCKAMTASCMACSEGISVEDFCNQLLLHSDIANVPGCPAAEPRALATESSLPARACCKAMTASCMSCSEGVSVEDFCARPSFAHTVGCPKTVIRVCPHVRCSSHCEYGYQFDRDGCQTCTCATPAPTTRPVIDDLANTVCCTAMTAGCMSCREGISVEELCARPSFAPVTGCDAVTRACPLMQCRMACRHGFLKDSAGCDLCQCAPAPPQKRFCCMAMTPECMSCTMGLSVDDFCAQNPFSPGCAAPTLCCEGMTAECLACKEGISVEELCARPSFAPIEGCTKVTPEVCCMAMTAGCLACDLGMSLGDFCADPALQAAVPGCPSPLLPSSPRELSARGVGPHRAIVTWASPPAPSPYAYEVHFRRVGNIRWRQVAVSGEASSARLKMLVHDSLFDVEVFAVLEDGSMSEPAVTQFRTPPKAKSPISY